MSSITALDPAETAWYSGRDFLLFSTASHRVLSKLQRRIVVKTAKIICTLTTLAWASAALPASAQRVQFATPLVENPPSTAIAPTTAPPPATYGQPAVTPGASASPYPSSTFAPAPTYGAAPVPTLGNPVQPPPATWDPYATPNNAPSALLPQDPYFQSIAPPVAIASVQKFLQHVDLDYHWFAGNNEPDRHEELGINDVELSATFAFPMFFNSATPLLVTPGFAVHYWDGPLSLPPPMPPPDLPPQTYDAYLDAAWNPQMTPWLGAELNFRVGVYSDFNVVTTEALRYMGKGLFVLTFSPCIKIKAGVWYLDRNVVKILPAGGICWTPNADVYFNILFPNPKIGKRLTTWGNTEWWIYVSGDYGGGKWQITRQNGLDPNPYAPDMNGTRDTFDYNDIRVAVGLEFNTMRQLHGMFEVGGAFSREVIYESYEPHAYFPNDTVFIRAGLAY